MWDEIDNKEADKKAQQAEQDRKAFDACCQRIVSDPANAVFVETLKRIAVAASYTPGASFDRTAWGEGKRALAVHILHKGGTI